LAADGEGVGEEVRKTSFFEKKKQKSFASAVADSTDKCFLVLFFQKKNGFRAYIAK
jgi:hypothetical protein